MYFSRREDGSLKKIPVEISRKWKGILRECPGLGRGIEKHTAHQGISDCFSTLP